jgi:hypothetical protein
MEENMARRLRPNAKRAALTWSATRASFNGCEVMAGGSRLPRDLHYRIWIFTILDGGR